MGLYMRKTMYFYKVETKLKTWTKFQLLTAPVEVGVFFFPRKQIFMNIISHKLSFMLFVERSNIKLG